MVAVGAALSLQFGSACAALSPEIASAICEGDAACMKEFGVQVMAVQPRAAYNLTVYEGETKEIIGEDLTVASAGSTGTSTNYGTLTIQGDSSYFDGIAYNANGEGSTGTISNSGSGGICQGTSKKFMRSFSLR